MKSFLLVFAMVFGIAGTASALDFNVGPYFDGGIKDSTAYVKSFHEDAVPQIAVGLCSGSFAKVSNGDKHVADILSPCILGATTYEADEAKKSDVLVGFKVIDSMGFNAGLYYAPTRDEPRQDWHDNILWGFGFTLIGLGETIADNIP